jgi:hypothetical protein
MTKNPGTNDVARTRRTLAIGAAVAAFAIGLAIGVAGAPGDAEVRSARGEPSPSSRTDLLRYKPTTPRQPYDPSIEPFDYEPAPPLEDTPIDGYYLRITELEEVGGPRLGLPFHCVRCPAYRVDPGVETLILHKGRFWIEHQMSGWRALGHYEVDGDRFTIFNDANCSSTRGEYRWSRTRSALSFDVVGDVCVAEGERAHDLMFSDWIPVRPCLTGIRYWWPMLIGCYGGGSGVRFSPSSRAADVAIA